MKLTVGLALLIGTLVLACSTVTPVPAEPTSDINIPTVLETTPDIDATVEARVAHERAVDATVETRLAEEKISNAKPTSTPIYQVTDSPRTEPTETPTLAPTATSVPTPSPRPILPVTRIPTPTIQLIPSSTTYPTPVPTKVITDSSCVGKTMRFKIGDVWANESMIWVQGGGDELNLTASTTSLPLKHITSLPISELAQRVPPHVLVGSVNAADGTSISAWYEGTQLAATTVSGGSYSLIIDNGSCYSSVSDQTPTVVPMPTVTPTPIPTTTPMPPASSGGSNCTYSLIIDQRGSSFSGLVMQFKVGANWANETLMWQQGGGDELNLTAPSARVPYYSIIEWPVSSISPAIITIVLPQSAPPHVVVGSANAGSGTAITAWIDGVEVASTNCS